MGILGMKLFTDSKSRIFIYLGIFEQKSQRFGVFTDSMVLAGMFFLGGTAFRRRRRLLRRLYSNNDLKCNIYFYYKSFENHSLDYV